MDFEEVFLSLEGSFNYITNLLHTIRSQVSTPLTILVIPTLLSFLFLFFKTCSSIPGPRLYALTKWRLAYDDYLGHRTRTIHHLHQLHGSVVRIGPSEISFNSLSALKTIYGAGSGFSRTPFYRMFDVYGHPNLFTFPDVATHSERKKLLSAAYSKSSILKTAVRGVEEKVWEFMRLIEKEPEMASETFSSLHFYAMDNITHFLYGENFGATKALEGEKRDRDMLDDILDPQRRKLAWFAAHLPRYTKWLMSRKGIQEKITTWLGLLPQRKPTVYTGIRKHALEAWYRFSRSEEEAKEATKRNTIIGRLWPSHISQTSKGEGGLEDLEIASEVADHLLAGVDTTSDTLMFLFWALSLPGNLQYQEKLIAEVTQLSDTSLDSRGMPTVEATGKLPYLDAVIKETLRLYAPLPASEPRCFHTDFEIDGYHIPANTVVSCSPYTLHRNADVFTKPLIFNPERWFGNVEEVAEMKKWFWAFSSGGRMCIGIHLAMAEMTALTAAVYRKYRTKVRDGMEEVSPGITSRFEVFYDESKRDMKEHECWIDFISY